jgi:hexosaminidase
MQAYKFKPLEKLTDAQAKYVLGGQQLLWTEQSGPQNLDPIVWPRAAASAEVFWTGPGGNVTDALPRLHEVVYRFRRRGVRAISLQPEWCALRPNRCNW